MSLLPTLDLKHQKGLGPCLLVPGYAGPGTVPSLSEVLHKESLKEGLTRHLSCLEFPFHFFPVTLLQAKLLTHSPRLFSCPFTQSLELQPQTLRPAISSKVTREVLFI